MRNLKAALFGFLWALATTELGGLIYWSTYTRNGAPFKAEDLIFVSWIALSGWFLYLLPGLALGVASRFILQRFHPVAGTLVGMAIAALCGAVVGFLGSKDAPHVSMRLAVTSLTAAWALTALIVLPCAYFLFLKRPVHEGDGDRALADG